MDTQKVIALLKKLNATVPATQSRGGWIVSSCALGPWRHDNGKSHNQAFGVRKEPGDAFCNCMSCGFHGSLSDLVLEVRRLNKKEHFFDAPYGELNAMIEDAESEEPLDLDSPDIEEVLFGKKTGLHEFPEWWLGSFPAWRDSPLAIQYLDEREVPADVADALDLRFDTKEKRVCFPVRDFNGKLVGLHGRAIDEDTQPRYRMYLQAGKNNPIVWLGEHWVDRTRPIVVVEGPFDLASVRRVYKNVVSPLFANPSVDKILRMADALEQVTFFDIGKGGDAGREKFKQALGKTHVLHHVIPPNGKKDPGVCSPEELFDVLSEYVHIEQLVD